MHRTKQTKPTGACQNCDFKFPWAKKYFTTIFLDFMKAARALGLPDYCIFGAKLLTVLFVFAFCFHCFLDDTTADLAPKLQ